MKMRQYKSFEINILTWDPNLYKVLKKITAFHDQEVSEKIFFEVYDVIYESFPSGIGENKYKEILAVSKTFFLEACAEVNVVKLSIALALSFALKQDISIFEIDRVSASLKNKIRALLPEIRMSFGLAEGAPYGAHKMLSQCENAIIQGNYSVILTIMNQLKSSSYAFENIDCSWGLFFRFAFFVDMSFFLKYLETTSYENIEIILYSLRFDIKDVLENYNYSNKTYPFLRGLNYLFDFGDFILEQMHLFPCYADLLDGFIATNSHLFSSVLDFLYIKNKKSFNFTLGVCAAKNKRNFDFYIENADFSIDSLNCFSMGFMSIGQSKDSFISNVSLFLEKTLNKISPTHINENLGCLRLLMNYYSLLGTSKNNYLQKLKQYSDKIKELQNSWSSEDLTKAWVELFYCSLANYILNFQYTENELLDNTSVLYDKRNYLQYDSNSIDLMRKILLNPRNIQNIELIHLQEKKTYNMENALV